MRNLPKCHRRNQSPIQREQFLAYAVNDITCNSVHGSLSTCDYDGTMNFWGRGARTRLKSTLYPLTSLDTRI